MNLTFTDTAEADTSRLHINLKLSAWLRTTRGKGGKYDVLCNLGELPL